MPSPASPQRVADGVALMWPQSGFPLLAKLPELVPNLNLGLTAYLFAGARPGQAKAKIYRPDVPLEGFVPVDRVLTCPRRLLVARVMTLG